MFKFLSDNYNYVLFTALSGWILAQIIKVSIYFLKTKRISVERMFGAGGMPSSHSALVCSTAVGVLRKCGFKSTEFAIIAIFAVVVMYDAMGVRRAAGNHAKQINSINKGLLNKNVNNDDTKDSFKELKEFLGHTPLEVLGGAILGIVLAFIIPMR